MDRRARDDRDRRARHGRGARDGRCGRCGVGRRCRAIGRARTTGLGRAPDHRAGGDRTSRAESCSSATETRSAGWMVRESGAIPPKAAFEITASIGQLDQAASLISHPLGQVLPSLTPGRTSTARRIADRRRRRDHAVELPDRAGDAVARPGAGARERRRAQERPEHAGDRRRDHRARVRGGRPARRASCTCSGAAPTSGSALVEDPNVRHDLVHRVDQDRAHGRRGRGPRRSSAVVLELGGNSPLIVLEDADIEAASSAGAWGSFLHQGQICLAVSRHLVHESIAEDYLAALTERAARCPWGTRRRTQVALGPIINAEAGRARAADRRRDGRCRRHGADRRRAATACSTRRPCCATYGRRWPPSRRRSSARSPRSRPSGRRGGRRARERDGVRAGGRGAVGQPGARRRDRRAGCTPGWSTSTTRRSTRSRPRPFGGFKASSNGGHFGGVGQLELWTEWQWLTSREKAEPFPF